MMNTVRTCTFQYPLMVTRWHVYDGHIIKREGLDILPTSHNENTSIG